MSERDLERQVVELARLLGWHRYHPLQSRGSEPGWPDETLVRGSRLIFAELKSEGGRLSPAQTHWLELLGAVETVEVELWRPQDFDRIVQALR